MMYKTLTPDDFVPLLLHLEMGMVNQVWDSIKQWIDDHVEMIPPHEQDAGKKLSKAKIMLDESASKKHEAEKTINIDIQERKAEIKLLKTQLH
jgi:hypothetical protein